MQANLYAQDANGAWAPLRVSEGGALVGAGSFQITFNTKSGTTTEQPVINFAVIKAVAA